MKKSNSYCALSAILTKITELSFTWLTGYICKFAYWKKNAVKIIQINDFLNKRKLAHTQEVSKPCHCLDTVSIHSFMTLMIVLCIIAIVTK